MNGDIIEENYQNIYLQIIKINNINNEYKTIKKKIKKIIIF